MSLIRLISAHIEMTLPDNALPQFAADPQDIYYNKPIKVWCNTCTSPVKGGRPARLPPCGVRKTTILLNYPLAKQTLWCFQMLSGYKGHISYLPRSRPLISARVRNVCVEVLRRRVDARGSSGGYMYYVGFVSVLCRAFATHWWFVDVSRIMYLVINPFIHSQPYISIHVLICIRPLPAPKVWEQDNILVFVLLHAATFSPSHTMSSVQWSKAIILE